MEEIEACYEAAKSIYPNTARIAEEAEKVHASTGMNESSAKCYIENFFRMREGKNLGRCVSEKAARYYFEHIYDEVGAEALRSALDSLQGYLSTGNQNRPGLQKLVNQFRRKAE